MNLDPQLIDRGTPNGDDGDDARLGARKINENFEHLFEATAEQKVFLLSDNTKEALLTAVNGATLFEIKYPLGALIIGIKLDTSSGGVLNTKVYKLLRKQGGNFGTGGTQLFTEDLRLINVLNGGVEDAVLLSDTVVIDYGNIGSTSVVDHINALAVSETIAAPSTNLTIIKATVNSVLEEYLFIGSAGDYGLNDTAITAEDLQLIEDAEQSVIPTIGVVNLPDTGSFNISLSNYLGTDYSSYTLTIEDFAIGAGAVQGGNARLKGNWANKPTVTGATEAENSLFIGSQVLYMYVEKWADGVIFWFDFN